MSEAIISPSVLAVSQLLKVGILLELNVNLQSDLSNLSNECQRMMDNGAQWLHMGRWLRSTSQ